MAAVTASRPQWRAAVVPAASSTSRMITPPCTLPARLASSWFIVRTNVTSLSLTRRGGRAEAGSLVAGSLVAGSVMAGTIPPGPASDV